MASLTHVCMWKENEWKPVTVEEAARLHPGGTVSAHSGLFMCDLCGQYVTLTDGDIRTRYFKHSANEKSKDCPERTFGTSYLIPYGAGEHDLPLRITDVSPSSFRFEIGLIRIPTDMLGENFRIEIQPIDALDVSYVFGKERLNCDGITYVPVGNRPSKKYTISFKNGNNKLNDFWPKEVNGIDSDGTIFDKSSGKKLAYDADVEIEKGYYLLKRGAFSKKRIQNIQIREITRKEFGWETWALYEVYASEFNEDAARFFLNLHCRLTEHPVSLHPVWPLFVEGNYILKHNRNSMYMLVEGNVETVRTFPAASVRRLNDDSSRSKLYSVVCSGRQQLISVGRSRALQYTYFWREPLDQEGLKPEFFVTDLAGNEVDSGEMHVLPHGRVLRFKLPYEGELTILNDERIVEKCNIPADKYMELDGLSFGLCVRVAIGLDIIWQIRFTKHQVGDTNDEMDILRRITDVSGASIALPHSMRNILIGMSDYPQICQWIRKHIQMGTINEQSYRRLQDTFRNINLNK